MAAGSCTLCSCGKPTDVSDANFGLYLGNLRDGTSELLVPLHSDDTIGYIEGWSSDNVHFIFSDANYRLYLGDINGEITHIDVRQGVELSGWIDENRYLMENGVLGEIGKQELVKVIGYFSGTFAFLGH